MFSFLQIFIVLTESGQSHKMFIDNFSNLAQWEQSQLLSSIERLADMMDANEIDASPLLELNTMCASSTTKTDAPNT